MDCIVPQRFDLAAVSLGSDRAASRFETALENKRKHLMHDFLAFLCAVRRYMETRELVLIRRRDLVDDEHTALTAFSLPFTWLADRLDFCYKYAHGENDCDCMGLVFHRHLPGAADN